MGPYALEEGASASPDAAATTTTRLGGSSKKPGKTGKGKEKGKKDHASYDAAGRINLKGILVRACVLLVSNLAGPISSADRAYDALSHPPTHTNQPIPQVGNPYTDPVENLVGMIDALWGRDLIPEDVYAKWAQTCVSKDPDAYYSKVGGCGWSIDGWM